MLLSRPEIVEELRRHFGDKVIAGGDVDRAAMARIVFRDPEALDWLESLLHPHVKRLVDEWAREQDARRRRRLSSWLKCLSSSRAGSIASSTTCCSSLPGGRAPASARRQADRRGVRHRSRRQLDERIKAARSDFVVDNSGSRARLKTALAEVYAVIIAAANESGSGRAARRGR